MTMTTEIKFKYVQWPKQRGRKGNPDWYVNRNLDKEAREYMQGIKRNIKIIEGQREDGSLILRDLDYEKGE